MSAKLLYSLSDNKSNQQKHIGCINGFLQFFDPHHLISSRSANNLNRRILPPDENKHQGGRANDASKKTKGKHLKAIKTQEYSSEPSRISVSSSSASTTMSSTDYEWSVKNTCPSPINNAPREQAARHAKNHVDSPRLVSRSESFRSASSNQSVPILPLRKKNPNETVKDTAQFSCEISSLKLRDLPRLSLDSRQRTVKESVRESKDDLVLSHLRRETQNLRNAQNLPEEPASYRPPSNIVAKLMGLEALPDCSPSIKIQVEQQDDSSIWGSFDFLSRSSRTIDESRVRGVLHSSRSNCRESKTPRERKDNLLIKPRSSPTVSKEHSPEPYKNTRTVFAKIEERMNDLDFRRSGKDLRALKQILETINREKTKDTKSRDTTPVRESKKESVFAMQDLPLKSLHQVRIGKAGNGAKESTQKKTTKHTAPMTNHSHGPSHKTHFTKQNFGERSPRPKTASKGQPVTKVNVPNPKKLSKTINTASGSKTKQHKPDTAGLRPQTEKLQRKSYILKSTDGVSKVISTDSTFLSQGESTNTYFSKISTVRSIDQPGMKNDTWQLAKNENAEEVSGDTYPEELAITVKEQPSPVSVLDAGFYGDESPSPVKKKPTPFKDYETNATDTVPEWRDIGVTNSPNSLIPSFSYEKEDIEIDNFTQTVQALRQLDYTPGRSPDSVESQEEVTLDKACVSEILAAAGILDDIRFNAVTLQLDPKLFHLLEQTKGSRYISGNGSKSKQDTIIGANESSRRKLLFDTVNEILSQKLSSNSLGSQPQLFKKKLAPATDRRGVLQEIFTEINQLQTNSLNQSLDDENDFLIPIVQKDLAHATGNWTDVSSEIPGLILDIERLIFKDLIVELVN